MSEHESRHTDVNQFMHYEDEQQDEMSPSGPNETIRMIARTFVDSGKPSVVIDYRAMGRQFGGVAQDLRRALKEEFGTDGKLLFEQAWVSVDNREGVVRLKRRPAGWVPPKDERRGRPKNAC